MSGPDDRMSREMEDRANSIQAPHVSGGTPDSRRGLPGAHSRTPIHAPGCERLILDLRRIVREDSSIASVRLGQSASWGSPGVYSRSGADDGTFGATVTYPRSGRRFMSVRGVGIGRSTRW